MVAKAGRKAEVGFEPTDNGFAIRPLSPLGYSAAARGARLANRILAGKAGAASERGATARGGRECRHIYGASSMRCRKMSMLVLLVLAEFTVMAVRNGRPGDRGSLNGR
jgi:hypothetical protein